MSDTPHAGHVFPGQQSVPIEPAVKAKATSYLVYSSTDGGAALQYVGRTDAPSETIALKRTIPEPAEGTKYVAIPARSFRLRGGKAKTTPVVTFS